MKSLFALALTLVLTAALLVGCGCTNQNSDNTVAPTVLPTNEEIWNTTESPTRHTTEPTATHATTEPSGTRETIDNGNGGIDDSLNPTNSTGATGGSTTATEGTPEGTMEGRARRMMPGTR